MSYQADNKKEDFRRYLEKNGIIDSLTKVLVGLYEEPDKPDNPLDFIKQFLAGPQIGPVSADMLKAENEDLKARTAVLAERLDAAIRKLRELGVQISDDGASFTISPAPPKKN
ncbi:hypothetical protein RI367_003574 [Sorochytrium milnesiophthora]